MKANRAKRSLASGGRVFGTGIFEFATTGIVRIGAAAGADFLFLDAQHTGWTFETLRTLLATGRGEEVALLVRTARLDSHLIGQMLDLGADGIVAPDIETADDARRLVEYTRYPPNGIRGAAFGLSRDDYRPVPDLRETMRAADDETLLVALVESETGISNLDGIAATEGIDVVWVGQYDLTISMGIPGEFLHPRFRAAVAKLLDACTKHGKAAAMMATSTAEGLDFLDQGFRCVGYASDVPIYRRALADGIAELKGWTGA